MADQSTDVADRTKASKGGKAGKAGSGTKRYGLQDGDEERTSKRARVEDDD